MQEEQKAAAAQVPASPPNILIETPSGVTPGSGTPPGSTETRTNILADEASEASRMKREEALKMNLLGDKARIKDRIDQDTLIVQQITTILFRFEMLLGQSETSTITRIKIYELLTMMLRLQCREIDYEIATN